MGNDVGYSVVRVLSAFFASAAVAGAFVCAVAVVKPGAGPALQRPGSAPSAAEPAPALHLRDVLRVDVKSAIALPTPLPAVAPRVPAAAPVTLFDANPGPPPRP